MHNNFVKDYCSQHNLEILGAGLVNYIVMKNSVVAEFKNNEKLITFFNSDGTIKTTIKKGDLVLFMIEGDIVH